MREPEPRVPIYPPTLPEPTRAEWLYFLCLDQRQRWHNGERLTVRQYVELFPRLRQDTEAVLELISNEVVLRLERGEAPRVDEYLSLWPEQEQNLRRRLALQEALFGRPHSTAGQDEGTYKVLPDVASQRTVPPRVPDDLQQLTAIQPPPLPNAFDNAVTVASGSARTVLPVDWPNLPGYEVLGVLGRGGMGVVYRARQIAAKRVVALKMLSARAHADRQEVARFQTEAEAVARLNHPNIVQIFDVGWNAGRPFFSLEYVEGGTLEHYVDGRPLPDREAASIVDSLARAVDYAHDNDIVHRDLKPMNILLTLDGVPKITDFGLAKKLEEERGQTQSGAIVGTPSYMSPEQAAGKTRQIGPAADVYGLGAILYTLLTGRPPFQGNTPVDTILKVISEEPRSPRAVNPKVNPDLETVCLKCLRKEPEKRYPTARALANDLRRFLSGEPVRARPLNWWRRADEWGRANPGQTILGGVLGLIMLVMCVASPAHLAGLPMLLLVLIGLARPPVGKFLIGTGIALLLSLGVVLSVVARAPQEVQFWQRPANAPPQAKSGHLYVHWPTSPLLSRLAVAFDFSGDHSPGPAFWAALGIPILCGIAFALWFRPGSHGVGVFLALSGVCALIGLVADRSVFFLVLGVLWGLVAAGVGRLVTHLLDRPLTPTFLGVVTGFLMCPSWQFAPNFMRFNVRREDLLFYFIYCGVSVLFMLVGGIVGAVTGPRLHPPPKATRRRRH
jgi:hypothetical protein